MKYKIIILLILIIFSFSVSSVSAMDDTNDTVVSEDNLLSVNDLELQSNDTYSVSEENNDNVICEDSSSDDLNYGYWAIASDVKDLNFTDLSEHGVTDILLNYQVYEKYNQSFVESLALTAKEYGINIHIWAQIFYYGGSWIKPVDWRGNVNYKYFDSKIAELETYARTKGIAGIHYDYLRFLGSEYSYNSAWQNPGGKEAITYFVKQSCEAIRKINPDIIISATLMPEINMLEPVYGIEYSEISKYFDVVMPLAYRGKFNQDSDWVKYITEYFVNNSHGSEVWTGLQGYVSDYDKNNLLPIVELNNDTISALNGGAKGVIMSKINNCPNMDFNNLTVDENKLTSFEYLYYKISSASETLDLENDFIFNETTDNAFVNGVKIDHSILINGNNHTIDGKNLARIFNITGNSITLANINFKDAFTDNNGGAAYITGNWVMFANCTFTGSFAENLGGAVYIRGDYGLFENCTFINSFTNDTGAGLFVDGYNVRIFNSSFIDNFAKVEAAALYIKDNRAVIEGCKFINNSAKYTGAVLLLSQNARIYDSYFENNTAEVSAAAVGMGSRSNMGIINCVFVNNGAYNEGGAAIFINKALNTKIINSTFIDNFAHYNGGAIFWSYGDNGIIVNSTFINNTATEKGGAIYHIGDNITLADNVFVNNSCVNGSALYLNNGDNNVITKNVFLSNDIYMNNIDNSQILNSVILDETTLNNSIVLFINNWFGNTNDNINESLNDYANNWLYLNAMADKTMIGEDASVKFYFDQFNTFKSFDIPEITLKLSGENVILENDSVLVGESFNCRITDYGAYVNASFDDVILRYDLPIADVNVIADNLTKYYGGSQRFIVNVLDSQSNPISNKSVNISINGAQYERVTNENGSASVGINLNPGEYNATINADNITVYSIVEVLSTVDAEDLIKVFKNESQFYASFKDSDGNALANSKVSFNINGVIYERTTDVNGSAKLNINLMAGEYVITSYNSVTGEMHANNITVLSRFSENSDLVKYYRNDSQYVVRVIGDDGNPLGAGENVTFNINGVLYTRSTNESGYAKLNINLGPGDYIVTAEYKTCMVSNNIKVKPVLTANDMSMTYGDGSKFTSHLLDGEGNPYQNQTIDFNINGVFYKRTTDVNGDGKLDINLMPGEYIITSSYNGYNISNKITVSS